jgi:hypothetical protein
MEVFNINRLTGRPELGYMIANDKRFAMVFKGIYQFSFILRITIIKGFTVNGKVPSCAHQIGYAVGVIGCPTRFPIYLFFPGKCSPAIAAFADGSKFRAMIVDKINNDFVNIDLSVFIRGARRRYYDLPCCASLPIRALIL